jgi:hypothetical protein
MIPTFPFLMMLACAVFYYRLGESEYSSGWLLAVASLALWLGAAYLLSFGWLGCLAIQGGLFGVLCLWNLWRSPIK